MIHFANMAIFEIQMLNVGGNALIIFKSQALIQKKKPIEMNRWRLLTKQIK